MIDYIPKLKGMPVLFGKPTAWGNIATIIPDIIERFDLGHKVALEFGTATGYSASALSNYFNWVLTLDIFEGINWTESDKDAQGNFEQVQRNLEPFDNITVVKQDYKDFIKDYQGQFDLIHIDIEHTYSETYRAGEWAVHHSDCVIFHDTEQFKEVMDAVTDLSVKYGFEFYNYKESNGLGILIKKV